MSRFMLAWAILIGLAFIFYNVPVINRYLVKVGERVSNRFKQYTAALNKGLRVALSLGILATFVYFYIAPRASNASQKFFTNTALFFGGVTVFIFVLCLCLFVYELDSLGASFLIATFLMANILFLQESSLALGRFPWDSRRFMLVVVPMLAVGFGYLANRLWMTRRVAFRTLVIIASAFFLILFCYYLAPIFNLTEYKGVDRQLTAYAKKMDKDVVIFTGGYLGETVGLPLRYQHGVDARKIFTLSDPARFAELVEKYNREGKKVMLEASGIGANEIPYNPAVRDLLEFKKAFKMQITYPRLFPVSSGRPSKTGVDKHETEFYYLEPKGGSR
jgi:hypothetical protein